MKRTFRGLSLIMAAVLCLTLLPMTALADRGGDTPPVDPNAQEFDIQNGVLVRYNGTGGAVVIPNNVISIGDRAFWNRTNVTSVTIPNGITSIGESAFYSCTALTSITIPNSVTSIGESAFSDCTALTSLTLGNGLNRIGVHAFSKTRITSIVIPNSVTSIGGWAFYNCTALTSVTLGTGITTIPLSAFDSCTTLTSITIPNNVTSIENQAFQNTGLTSITIPNSVTSIGWYAFPENTIIRGVAGSAAETWAQQHNRTFEATGGTIPTDPPKTENAPNLDSASDWAQEQVNQAFGAGLIPSTLQSSYKQATTRAEFCALAVTLYEVVTGKEINERKTFDDTTDVNVEKAAAVGIVAGVGNNKFDPNGTLTREQAAVMLARVAEAVGKPLPKQAATFGDNGSIATWAIEQVGQIQAAGIMSGTGNNTFSPKTLYTREQSIITILRLYDVIK